ncbi:hypothetical protein [Nannocystis punicea]|uniref:Uncharacterized protein n=1 Tax=Nannocystis punicea TaxID=2995304 RepID=A0ABY7H6D0_9BACT|nr:hypothetical protein [Nannocystis poenicansa]WAS94826.1 hypothetical protein O0S08_01585 [Nannocystis poenicansa]
MRSYGPRKDVELPCGLPRAGDGLHRRATLTAMDGAAELAAADQSNPFFAAHLVLARCLCRLGARTEVDVEDVRRLLPIDRDFLLIELDRLTFGNRRYQTIRCPAADCRRRMDIEIDLSTIVASPSSPARQRELSLASGRAVRVRLPCAGDQEALFDAAADARAALLVARCLVGESEPAAALDAAEQVACALAIGNAAPRLDLALDLECPTCGGPFSHEYEPVRGLFGELRRSRSELLTEVHWLALHYHWSQAEILGLPRSLRREYLDLLERDRLARGQVER